jgi:hypothetical protein
MSDSEDEGSRTTTEEGQQTTVLGFSDGFIAEGAIAGLDWRVSRVGGSPVSPPPLPSTVHLVLLPRAEVSDAWPDLYLAC